MCLNNSMYLHLKERYTPECMRYCNWLEFILLTFIEPETSLIHTIL